MVINVVWLVTEVKLVIMEVEVVVIIVVILVLLAITIKFVVLCDISIKRRNLGLIGDKGSVVELGKASDCTYKTPSYLN